MLAARHAPEDAPSQVQHLHADNRWLKCYLTKQQAVAGDGQADLRQGAESDFCSAKSDLTLRSSLHFCKMKAEQI
jgi:2-hydroxy-3-keto-5-methylthiopentenyl-1-phosphate phosphatase